MRALLAALLVMLCGSLARADDFGPQRDIDAVRTAVPTLLTRLYYERNFAPDQIVVSDIVVAGDSALASWRIGDHDGLVGMRRIDGTWWDLLEGYSDRTSAHATAWWFEGATPWRALPDLESTYGPTSAELRAIGMPKSLVRLAASHNPIVAASDNAGRGVPSPRNVDREVLYLPPGVTANGSSHGASRAQTAGYEIVLVLAPNDATLGSAVSITGHRPAERAKSLYAVQFAFSGPRTVTFENGSRINVWFPYVLNPNARYTLAMNGTLGTIDAYLHDNTLSFELPSFTARPGAKFAGDIFGR